MLITKAELAARHGVTVETVQGWKRRGYLVMKNGKVDVGPTEINLANRSPLGRRDGPREDETPVETAARIVIDGGNVFASIKQAQLYRESYTAKLKQLEYELAAGESVNIALAKQALIAEYQTLRSAVLSMPARMAPRLVNIANPNVIQAMLDEAARETLEVVSTKTTAVFDEAAARRARSSGGNHG